MANNRIGIVCNICGNQEHGFGKYYPSTGWYGDDNWLRGIFEFMNNHSHDEECSMDGPTHFALGFEVVPDVEVISPKRIEAK